MQRYKKLFTFSPTMNSRKKRFWEQWQKRNRELAEKDVAEANKRLELKFLGYSIEQIAKIKHFNP